MFFTEESESTGHTMCVALDTTDNCKFYYNYKEMPDGSMELTAEKEKSETFLFGLGIISSQSANFVISTFNSHSPPFSNIYSYSIGYSRN